MRPSTKMNLSSCRFIGTVMLCPKSTNQKWNPPLWNSLTLGRKFSRIQSYSVLFCRREAVVALSVAQKNLEKFRKIWMEKRGERWWWADGGLVEKRVWALWASLWWPTSRWEPNERNRKWYDQGGRWQSQWMSVAVLEWCVNAWDYSDAALSMRNQTQLQWKYNFKLSN